MNAPLKILWLAPYPIRPGEHPAPWLVSLAAALAQEGHHLTILTPSSRTDRMQRRLTEEGYQLIIIPYKGGIRHLLSGFRTQVNAMAAYLQEHAASYDIVHVHGTELQLASALPGGHRTPPHVISIQGIISLYKHQLTNLFSKRYLYWSLSSLYEKQEIRRANYFFCRTEWDQHFVRTINPHAGITVCWEMLRPEFFRYHHPFTGKGILFMGGDNPLKALPVCLEVFSHLAVRHPDLRLHIVGSLHGDAYRQLLRRLDDRPLSRDNVVIHGALDAPAICRLYTECFCLYHPSLIDNSPNSVCEAQVAGLPVVATKVGGVSSLIDDGRTGLLVRKNDVEGHASTLDRLFRDSGLQRWISRNSRERAQQRHDKTAILNKTLDTYRKIIALSTTATAIPTTSSHVNTQIPA